MHLKTMEMHDSTEMLERVQKLSSMEQRHVAALTKEQAEAAKPLDRKGRKNYMRRFAEQIAKGEA